VVGAEDDGKDRDRQRQGQKQIPCGDDNQEEQQQQQRRNTKDRQWQGQKQIPCGDDNQEEQQQQQRRNTGSLHYATNDEAVRRFLLLASGTLSRGDGGEDRPTLLDLLTAAVWAGGLFGVVLDEVQDLREGFVTGVADVLIVGHTDLLRQWLGF
jgi:hypothetical protein